MEFYFLYDFCVFLKTCYVAQRGGAEWEGAEEVCYEDKHEERGQAGSRETLAGLTGVTLIRGESQIETHRNLTAALAERRIPHHPQGLTVEHIPHQNNESLLLTANLLIL